jgi:cyclophilin family peptidyl-prolyl cis-trans isomerase
MIQFQRYRFAAVICVVCLLAVPLGLSFGDDEPKSQSSGEKAANGEKAASGEKAANGDKPTADAPDTEKSPEEPAAKNPTEEWNELSKRKIKIARQLRKLTGEFKQPKTTEERKKEIRDEFTQLVRVYNSEIQAKMGELAEAVYQADPKNVEAGEVVMESAYDEGQNQRALDVAKKLLKSGEKSKYAGSLAINIAGATSFYLNKFEEAADYLKEAEEKQQLNDQYSQQFAEHLPAMLEFWKVEQEIRSREAKLEGDKQLPMVELTIGNGKKELGKVVLELFENEAPNAVANFISIVENKDKERNYNGVKFHRVLPNFMAQTGDLDAPGKKPLDYTIECECYQKNARKHFRGSLSMALKGRDTGDSQFFITHIPTYWLNEEVRPEAVHTVFGRVVKGMDVIDRTKQGDEIISAKILFKRDHEYKPKTLPNEKPES